MMLFMLMADYWRQIEWVTIIFQFLMPVILISLLLHIIFLFYFWDPYEQKIYKKLRLPKNFFEKDILDNFEHAWNDLLKKKYMLQEEMEKMQNILDSISEGILIINPQGIVVQHNPSIESMLNFPVKISGMKYWEVITHPTLNEAINEYLNSKTHTQGEIKLISPSEKNLQFELITLHGDQLDGQLLIKLTDLTRMRKLEKIRADFVANVSHELRSPLTAILGFVETLKDEQNLEEAKAKKFLSVVHQNVLRLTDIVQDLLILSKAELGEQIEYTKFLPSELMENVIDLYRQKIKEKNQTIDFFIQDNKREIRADRYRLRQIMINLIDNAIKYTPVNGKILLKQFFDNDYFIFSIEDTGIGIPYNDQDRIFERFYRVDKSRTDDRLGTGLGLSIVKNMVELHSGSIELRSELGKGSCFTVKFPIL